MSVEPCPHCGGLPDIEGDTDHTCVCPHPDGLCPDHDVAPNTIVELTGPPHFPEYLTSLTGFQVIDAERGVFLVDPPLGTADTTNPSFGHWCKRPGYHIETGEPLFPRYVLAGTGDHTVHSREPWHLEASLLCTDCELHGWIRDGRWINL